MRKALLAILLTVSSTAHAYPTAAVFTPTGEAKDGGQVGLLAYSGTNLTPSVSPGSSWFGAEVGLLPQWEYGRGLKFGGLEAGLDVITPYGSVVKPVLSAKLGLVIEGEWTPSVALGLMEVSPALPSLNYVYGSATKTFFFGRLTLGAGGNAGSRSQFLPTFPFRGTRLTAMVAYESPLIAKRLGFVADHLSGASEIGSTYLGATFLVADQTTVGAGAFIGPDQYNASSGFFVYLSASFDALQLFKGDK